MRNDDEEPKEVVTTAANHTCGAMPGRAAAAPRLRTGALAPILWGLAEQLGLEGEDVVEHAIDTPALEPVIGNHPSAFQLAPQQSGQRPIDPGAPCHLCLLEKLQAAIESELSHAMLANAHVPRTSTLPASVTLTLTTLSEGNG
jgi:hypothetical protein